MEGWRDGWRDGGTEGRRDGGTEGGRDGGMEGWRDGGMEGWRDGGMASVVDKEMYLHRHILRKKTAGAGAARLVHAQTATRCIVMPVRARISTLFNSPRSVPC